MLANSSTKPPLQWFRQFLHFRGGERVSKLSKISEFFVILVQSYFKGGTTPNFFQTKFSIFLHIRKKHKKRKFLRLIWALSDFRGPRGARKTENAKYGQKFKKGPIFNIFQKFQKCVNKYPILYQNAKFGGPRVKNVDFRAKKLIFRILENMDISDWNFCNFFFQFSR